MTVENVYRALSTMEEDYNIRPALIVMDYAQIIPVEHSADRVEQVGEAIIRSKELARYVGCPIVLCVQAGRRVDQYENQIPTASDCQWASQIEQAADKLLGIWRPSLTKPEGHIIDYAPGKQVATNQSLLIAKLLKQRMESAGHVFALHFAPEWVRLADLELER
jgi:replicative DNA helicase